MSQWRKQHGTKRDAWFIDFGIMECVSRRKPELTDISLTWQQKARLLVKFWLGIHLHDWMQADGSCGDGSPAKTPQPHTNSWDRCTEAHWGLSDTQLAAKQVQASTATHISWLNLCFHGHTCLGTAWIRVVGSWAGRFWCGHAGVQPVPNMFPQPGDCKGPSYVLQKGWEAAAVGEAPYQPKYAIGFRAKKIGQN